MSVVTAIAKNTIGLPFYRPRVALVLAAGTAAAVVMANTGLDVGQAFGQVAGNTAQATVVGIKEAVPYVAGSVWDAAPGAWEGLSGWAGDTWTAASSGATEVATCDYFG